MAKSLAFSQEVRTRCITLQGDDFNPSGTLTGELCRLADIYFCTEQLLYHSSCRCQCHSCWSGAAHAGCTACLDRAPAQLDCEQCIVLNACKCSLLS